MFVSSQKQVTDSQYLYLKLNRISIIRDLLKHADGRGMIIPFPFITLVREFNSLSYGFVAKLI